MTSEQSYVSIRVKLITGEKFKCKINTKGREPFSDYYEWIVKDHIFVVDAQGSGIYFDDSTSNCMIIPKNAISYIVPCD